jgi:hypothetical protein
LEDGNSRSTKSAQITSAVGNESQSVAIVATIVEAKVEVKFALNWV